MIVEFSVSNFRSIDDVQTLGFIASSDSAHESSDCVCPPSHPSLRLLKTAVLVGPNASGKSNLLSALEALRDLIVHASNATGDEWAARHHPFYAQTDKSLPTGFSIELLVEAVRYRYQVAFNAERVLSEELQVYIKSKPQRWYARRFDTSTSQEIWAPFSSGLRGPREAWRKATGARALFLTTAAQLNAAQLRPLLDWFDKSLIVSLHAAGANDAALLTSLQNPLFKAQSLKVLQATGFNVLDIRVAEAANRADSAAPSNVEILCERCGIGPIWLKANEFSSGAHRLLRLLGPLLGGPVRSRFAAIDEFDTHLHPLLSTFVLQLVKALSDHRMPVQTLLVCHTTVLMDLHLLRRDELWLMRMDENSASKLCSLKSFSPRRQESVARAYLRGRYGAIPRVIDFPLSLH